MSDRDETPSQELPAIGHDNVQTLLMAMRAVLRQTKEIGRHVEKLADTMQSHIVDIAVGKVTAKAQDDAIGGLTARVKALEDERADLARAILAKATTLVLILGGVVAVIIAAYLKLKGSP